MGVDLSPIQPDWCPPNLRFHVDNFEDEWGYGSGFDFVHFRHVGLNIKKPAPLLASIYRCVAAPLGIADISLTTMSRNMNSGGWIEFQDLLADLHWQDGILGPDDALGRMSQLTKQSLKCLDFDTDLVERLPLDLEKAGFTNVHHKIFRVPVGTWPRSEKMRYFGLMAREVLVELLRPLGSKPFQALGIPQSDINAIVSEAEDAFYNLDRRIYSQFSIVYAQKP